MNEKGKKQQVLFESALQRNIITGELEPSINGFLLWTDKGLLETIEKIEGVCSVIPNVNGLPNYYSVITDRRYDLEFVKAEVESAIILKLGEI
jgi:hypothetical protein